MLENSYWNIDSILLGMTKKECKLNYDLDYLVFTMTDIPSSQNGNTLSCYMTITLSDNVSNYEYLEIYYYDYDNSYYSIKTDIRGDVVMQTTAINLNNSGYYIKMNRYSISGNQLVYVESAEVSSVTDNRNFNANTIYTKVRIYKVIGYK